MPNPDTTIATRLALERAKNRESWERFACVAIQGQNTGRNDLYVIWSNACELADKMLEELKKREKQFDP